MTDDITEDPLSSNTAKLSISAVDEGNARAQVRELLNGELSSRRNSVVSFISINENEELDNSSKEDLLTTSVVRQQKRRRSSAQSLNIANGSSTSTLSFSSSLSPAPNSTVQKPPAKREKIHKKKLMKATQAPELEFNSSNQVVGKRLPFKLLRGLVLTAFNIKSNDKGSKWYNLSNVNNISKVVFCLVPGLDLEKLESPTEDQFIKTVDLTRIPELDFFYDTFDTLIRTQNPGSKDSIYSPKQTITNIPLTKNEKIEILAKSKSTKITINDLLLNEFEMSQYNYPINLNLEDNPDWVQTKPFTHEGSTIFALDCEFCEAECGKVLTRVSIVNFQGEVVLDTYVKPKEEITNYLTKYSGITPENLENVTTDLKDIQNRIINIVSSDDILIGHSLESDLNVMKIKHRRIVDTSITFQHVRGPPSKPSLKWLATTYLGRKIQNGEQTGEGHSSIEDATACLDLVKLKILEGKLFGNNVGEISIFEKMSLAKLDEFESLVISYSQYKEQESFQNPKSYHVKNVYVNNDEELVDEFIKQEEGKNFILLNLRELEFALKWSSIPSHYNGPEYNQTENDISQLYTRTNQRLKTIYSQLPANSLMIVHSTTGDPNNMFKLQAIKRNFQKMEREGEDVTKLPKSESWDFEKQQLLFEATELARDSIAFVNLKKE
jgi:RNA exonuclease 1